MKRQSNIELLRIVSMLMVLAVHIDGASLGLPDTSGGFAGLSGRDIWQLAVESAAIIGVNCFTMISGYFGIRLRWRSAGKFLYACLFYAVGIYTLALMAGRCTLTQWAESWLVLSHTDLWYVPAYFGLMLLSPLLNVGTEALGRREFGGLLAAFVIFNVWCGWWWRGSFNPTGYTVVQLVMVYLMARYIRLHVSLDALRRRRSLLILLYIAATAGIFVSAIYLPGRAFAYNSPIVLLSSAAFFGIFLTLRFDSAAVCYIARSAFAVYLIHKMPPVWVGIVKPTACLLWAAQSPALFTLSALLLMVGIYLVAMAVDAVQRRLSRCIFGA